MSDDQVKKDETPAEETAEATAPKARKLTLTKRVVRQFNVRSGLQTGRDDDDYDSDPQTSYRIYSYYG